MSKRDSDSQTQKFWMIYAYNNGAINAWAVDSLARVEYFQEHLAPDQADNWIQASAGFFADSREEAVLRMRILLG